MGALLFQSYNKRSLPFFKDKKKHFFSLQKSTFFFILKKKEKNKKKKFLLDFFFFNKQQSFLFNFFLFFKYCNYFFFKDVFFNYKSNFFFLHNHFFNNVFLKKKPLNSFIEFSVNLQDVWHLTDKTFTTKQIDFFFRFRHLNFLISQKINKKFSIYYWHKRFTFFSLQSVNNNNCRFFVSTYTKINFLLLFFFSNYSFFDTFLNFSCFFSRFFSSKLIFLKNKNLFFKNVYYFSENYFLFFFHSSNYFQIFQKKFICSQFVAFNLFLEPVFFSKKGFKDVKLTCFFENLFIFFFKTFSIFSIF